MLVDYGSSHSFVSSKVASELTGVSSLLCLLSVKVANGNVRYLILSWSNWLGKFRGFKSDMKVIPLQHYDVILGYEWLEFQSYELGCQVDGYSLWGSDCHYTGDFV
jgi:hypothetical protein